MLGKKLKVVRRERGYSLEELAGRTGFSKSFLSQIENNKNSPSIASLKKITQSLDISIGELFEADRGDQVYFLRKADRTPFEVVKDKVIFEFGASKVPNRKMEVIFFTLLPGGESEGEYTHEGEEFGTVLEGSLLFELGGAEYRMEPGDSIYFSSSTPHRWRNPSPDTTMRAIWVITPPSF
ncbi:MAG: cupin domain-containing protein [Deferrisomatales bacterium]